MSTRFYSLIAATLLFSTTSCINFEQGKSIIPDDMEMSQFKDIDFEDLQKKIDSRDDIETATDALRLYYPNNQSANAGNKFTLKSKKNMLGNSYLFFKQESLKDDSLQAIAFLMEYEKSIDGKITIVDLKESFNCREGRGHQEWSGELCK